ncbi:MAG: hypothetical protein U1F56_21985 [Rubrivivax sp.]
MTHAPAWLAALLLAACASSTAPPAAGPVAPPAPPAPETGDPSSRAFEREQADRAARAEARGLWAEAAWAWEVLAVLRPDDAGWRDRAVAARQKAASEAAARVAAADAALRRGDLDAAAQSYLEALAFDPELRAAADALRSVERERERRRLAARNGRLGQAARRAPDEMPAPAAPVDPEQQRRLNAAREHAALLSSQGDLDAAIQLLRDAMPARPDPGMRGQLVDLYVQKAESLRRRDLPAARAALDAALALDRRHAGALALQRQLGGAAAAPPAAASAPRR